MYRLPDPARLPKRQFTVTVLLEAPIEECFAAASAERAMMAWVPNPISVEYDHSGAREPYGAGSFRTVRVKPGVSLVEVIFISEAPRLCGYFIPAFGFGIDLFLKNYQGRMNFEPKGERRTLLTWNGYFDCPGWRRFTEPLFRSRLRGLVAGMAQRMQDYVAKQG